MAEPPVGPEKPPRILIVDDEPYMLEICSRVAADLGYECMTAGSEEEAIGIMERHRFDIVLTDVCTPEVNGFELFRHSKAKAPQAAVAMNPG